MVMVMPVWTVAVPARMQSAREKPGALSRRSRYHAVLHVPGRSYHTLTAALAGAGTAGAGPGAGRGRARIEATDRDWLEQRDSGE